MAKAVVFWRAGNVTPYRSHMYVTWLRLDLLRSNQVAVLSLTDELGLLERMDSVRAKASSPLPKDLKEIIADCIESEPNLLSQQIVARVLATLHKEICNHCLAVTRRKQRKKRKEK